MNVMLSYRSSDSDFMEELAAHLRNHGIDPWIDKHGITPGQRWRDALLQELRSCDKVVAILSPAYPKASTAGWSYLLHEASANRYCR